MTVELITATGLAFWLGIVTAICPCPMATNIAAISFVSKRVDSPATVWMTGMVYTLGRMVAYSLLGILILQGLFASITLPSVRLVIVMA